MFLYDIFSALCSRLIVRSRKASTPRDLYPIALKFDRHLGSTAVDDPVQFQSDTNVLPFDLAPSRLCEMSR